MNICEYVKWDESRQDSVELYNILSKLKEYSVTGINQKIIDIKVLYIELDSSVYYNAAKSSSPSGVKTKISNSLTTFGESLNSNTSGARFKYSKSIQVIDESDVSITSNITKVIIRRNLNALLNEFAEYELCYGNRFHVNPAGGNIKSTGFRILGQTPNSSTEYYYLTDVPNPGNRTGILSVVRLSTNPGVNPTILVRNSGTVDYITGEIRLNRINITDTALPNGVIEIQAYPESNDIVGLKDLYLSLDISKSKINMFKDVISSGENTSGVVFSRDYYQSSYYQSRCSWWIT